MLHLARGILPQNLVLQDRYVVLHKLGQGGMGAVYKVADKRLGNKLMALKELSISALSDPQEQAQARAAFEREARMLARLDHLNIPQVSNFFIEHNKYYIVMELVQGKTLEQHMQHQPHPCTEQEVRDWAMQLCNVLTYLHGQNPPVIFRDLKPANIMLSSTGQLKLIDFGIARLFKSGKTSDTQQIGTHGYAPPEQYGPSQTDPRSDIYSFGVVLHHLLTRHNPALTPFKLLPVRQINPQISPALEQIIMTATQHDITQRYQSIAAMKYALSLPPSALPPMRQGGLAQGMAPKRGGQAEGMAPKRGGQAEGMAPKRAGQAMAPKRAGQKAPSPNELTTRVNLQLQKKRPPPAPPIRVNPQVTRSPAPPATTKKKKSAKKGGCFPCLVRLTVLTCTLGLVAAGIGLLIYNSGLVLPSDFSSIPMPAITPTSVLLAEAPSSPDSSNLIAYTSQYRGSPEIYISDPTNNQAWLLPGLPNNSSLPSWAPGGERLAFRSNESGTFYIYTVNIDGSDLRQLTFGSSENHDPAWSPDGSQIAFVSTQDGNYEIYTMNPDGKNLRRVTFIEDKRDNDPNWSPDSQWLVFESGRNNRYEVYKMRPDGSELTLLVNEGDSNSTPAWSPDGNRIAFERKNGSTFQIWLMNADGSNQEQLTFEGTRNLRPVWSPDGKQIAFTSNRDGEEAIWVIALDGNGAPYRLTPIQGFDAAWTR